MRRILFPCLALLGIFLLHQAKADDQGKVQSVPKTGLKITGSVDADDPKVNVEIGGKVVGKLPAKMHLVQFKAGKRYRIDMKSTEIDSVLVLQDKEGKQVAFDDDSGGNLDSLVFFDVTKDNTYKVFTASLKGTGNFTMTISDEAALKVHDVG